MPPDAQGITWDSPTPPPPPAIDASTIQWDAPAPPPPAPDITWDAAPEAPPAPSVAPAPDAGEGFLDTISTSEGIQGKADVLKAAEKVLEGFLTARFPAKPYDPNLSYLQNLDQGLYNIKWHLGNALLIPIQFPAQMAHRFVGTRLGDVLAGKKTPDEFYTESPEEGKKFVAETIDFIKMGVPGLDEKWAENMFENTADVVIGKAMVAGGVKGLKKRAEKVGRARAPVERGIHPEIEVAETTPFKPEAHAKRKAEQIETMEYAENRYNELEAKARAAENQGIGEISRAEVQELQMLEKHRANPASMEQIYAPEIRQAMGVEKPMDAPISAQEAITAPISPEIRPKIPAKRAEGVTVPQRKTTPEKLAEAVGKPNQVEVLKKSGVTGKKAQITEIVNDSIKSKLDAADVFERRGYIKEATRLREEARQAGETLKEADGYLTDKAVDKALEQPPEAGVGQALGERAAHLKEKKTVKLAEKAEKIEAQVPEPKIKVTGKTVDPHLTFLEDVYSVPTERGGRVFREVDRQGGTPEVFGYGTDSITHSWTKKTNYTKAQINTAIKSVLGKSKRKPTELQENIVRDIMEVSKKDFDLYSKGLEVQEARAPRAKPTQPDMIGAREGLEGHVPAEQAPIEAGGLLDVEGRKQTQAQAEAARMQESLPGAPGDVPAGGMAFGAKLPKYAGGNTSINLERVGGDYSVKKLINDTAGEHKAQMKEASRGVQTHEMTQKFADDYGFTYEDVLKRNKGEALNDWQLKGFRDVLLTSALRLQELQKKASKNNSDYNLAMFNKARERHVLIQAEVTGAGSEAGRALQAMRIQSMQKGAEVAGNYKAMLEATGGRETSQIILDRMATIDPENQVAVNIFIRDVTKATTPDKIYEAWINALLSSPTTHVVNITSNTLTALSAVPESFTGAAIDFARAKATGTPRERYFGESAHKVYGVWDGLKEGVRKGVWSFVNEMPTEGISKLEVGRIKAIKGKKGEVARLPGRFLITADEFFKAVNYTTEVRALAYRQAVKEGMRGKDRSKRIAEIIQNPSAELKQAATKEMLYRVFQQDLGPGAKKISGLRRHWGLRYIAPFIRTPVNIAKYGLERTPLNYGRILHKALKGELKKGELSTELGRATVGSMIGAVVFMHALEGNITGRGPDSKAERQALMRTGWQPYSVKVGDTYYSYGRLEPLGMVLGLHADASEIWEQMKEDEREDVATLIVKAITQNLTSKTWLRGVGDLMNAMTDPTRYAETWTQRVAGTVVPSGVAAVARGMDPTLRRAETILEKVRSRIPGHSKKGLPRLDLWGEAIRYGGGPMAQVFSPIYVSKKSASPIDHEMVRLEMTVGMPSKKIKGVKLTPAEHNEYIRLAGTMAKERLDELVATKKYKDMSDELKAKVIKSIITGTRKRAGADVFRKNIQGKR